MGEGRGRVKASDGVMGGVMVEGGEGGASLPYSTYIRTVGKGLLTSHRPGVRRVIYLGHVLGWGDVRASSLPLP